MAAQRCGGSWLRVLRFAWAVEEAWGLRRGSDSEVEVGGGRGSADVTRRKPPCSPRIGRRRRKGKMRPAWGGREVAAARD
ncbi:hypothetical protein CLOP_g24217 [Closterium sp. NIES-67]|nr:hypothetical protein CLOP_g24217 [Closterium sp. NIES-67]